MNLTAVNTQIADLTAANTTLTETNATLSTDKETLEGEKVALEARIAELGRQIRQEDMSLERLNHELEAQGARLDRIGEEMGPEEPSGWVDGHLASDRPKPSYAAHGVVVGHPLEEAEHGTR